MGLFCEEGEACAISQRTASTAFSHSWSFEFSASVPTRFKRGIDIIVSALLKILIIPQYTFHTIIFHKHMTVSLNLILIINFQILN